MENPQATADGVDVGVNRRLRTQSFSSDIASTSAKSVGTPAVPQVNPLPAYVAADEASKLVSAELERAVVLSTSAITMVNEFLDHVLYSIISTSHSVSLGPLKAAVPNVLKPRLGKAALRVAEEELREYLEDEEEAELNSKKSFVPPQNEFDADLVWKVARLRCMVYARLGDVEEEDEEEWLEKEQLLEQVAKAQQRSDQSLEVGPGAAIFLAAVIEYLGEQALYYAAQHAQKRHDSGKKDKTTDHEAQSSPSSGDAEVILLDGKDMNHVGRDSPLSRLWRSWRRNTRSGSDTISRSLSPESLRSPESPMTGRNISGAVIPPVPPIAEEQDGVTGSRGNLGASQAIPSASEHGQTTTGTDQAVVPVPERSKKRPTSLLAMPGDFPNYSSQDLSADRPEFAERSPLRPTGPERKRSSSMPTVTTPFAVTDQGATEVPPVITQDPSQADTEKGLGTDENSTKVPEINVPTEVKTDALPHESGAVSQQESGKEAGDVQQKSGLLNGTIAALAGASAGVLGAVGVHHISQEKHEETPSADRLAPSVSNDAHPVTSASITGPSDFDNMHLPQAAVTPNELEAGQYERDMAEAAARADHTPVSPMEEYKQEPTRAPQDTIHEQPSFARDIPTSTDVPVTTEPPQTPEAVTSRPNSGYRSPADVVRADSRPTSSRYSGSAYLASTLPVVNESDNGIASPHHIPPSPDRNDHKYASLQAVSARSSGVIAETGTSVDEMGRPRHSATGSRSSQHSKSSSSSSKLLGFTRDGQGRPQTIHQQRAAGDMSDDIRAAHSTTPTRRRPGSRTEPSETLNESRRSHGRIRSDSDRDLKISTPASEDAKRSLEVLINSDETLHYTLTPSAATFPQAEQAAASPKRTATQDLADFLRNTAPPGSEPMRNERSPRSPSDAIRSIPASVPVVTAMSRKPESKSRKADNKPRKSSDSKQESRTQASEPMPQSPIGLSSPSMKVRNRLGEPRSPLIEKSSGTRDLADYARSTGPTNEDQLPKVVGGSVRSAKEALAKSSAPPSIAEGSIKSATSNPNKPQNRLKFQARDARPSRSNEAADLIDFIREGPPRQQGDHRIDRHVAPFRTTMDSDDLNALAPKSDPHGNYRISDSAMSADTSNSQTALLARSSVNGTGALATAPRQPPIIETEDGFPPRTRRRFRDPYALDDSDDEVDEEHAPAPHRAEESMMDFLRNTAPPPGMVAQPFLSASDQAVRRSPSGSRLRDVLRGSRSSSPPGDQRLNSLKKSAAPRAESPHLTQVGSKLDTYKPTQVTHAAHVERNRNKPRPEARENPKRGYGETADLAEFMRNTGPPADHKFEPQPFNLSSGTSTSKPAEKADVVVKDDAGIRKFFSLKQKLRP